MKAAPVARVLSGHAVGQPPAPGGGDPLGQRFAKRQHDGLARVLAQLVAHERGRRILRVQDRSLGGVDVHGAHQPVVVEHLGAQQVEQRGQGRRGGGGEGGIGEGRGLRVRARIVEGDAVSPNHHLHGDPGGRRIAGLVLVDGALADILAVRERRDLRAYPPLGHVVEAFDVGLEAFGALRLHQRQEAPFPHGAASQLRLGVRFDDVPQPHVGEDQLPHVAPEPALLPQLDRRDTKGLLVDLHRLGVAGALDRAADVGPVAPAGGPRHQFAVGEHGLVEPHVRVLQVGAPDVVVDEDIPVVDVVAEEVHQIATTGVQGKGHQRQVLVLLQHPPPGIKESQREVAIVDERRAAASVQRPGHLVGQGLDPALEHHRAGRLCEVQGHGELIILTLSLWERVAEGRVREPQ